MHTRTPRKALRLTGILSAAIALTAALTSCASSADEPATKPSPAGTPTSAPSSAPDATPAPSTATTRIVLEIDGQEISGELNASPTSESLVAQLPLTLSFRDYGGQELIAELPTPLDLDGAPTSGEASPLTIGYYSPDQSLVLYYDHVGPFPGIVPIGSYGERAAITNATGEVAVTLRAAD
ncbi:cyclophilin-like fold protein [Microbacterium sp. P05]|uniref:cyclophilin-like fold protein n=1 Tax=Microbacterium sp. P05 TaxID=3366948 RepID=UPI003747596E